MTQISPETIFELQPDAPAVDADATNLAEVPPEANPAPAADAAPAGELIPAATPQPAPAAQPATAATPASETLPPQSEIQFATAPLLSEMPSFSVTPSGEIMGAETMPAETAPAENNPLAKNTTLVASGTFDTSGNPEMDTYFAIFTQTLKDAYQIPNDIGSRHAYTVRIRYEVAADGTIGAVTVVRTSGSAAYDASVVAAFRTMRNIGPRPDGRSTVLMADFRI